MGRAILSLMGLYDYDNTILDGMKAFIPSDADPENLCKLLLVECAQIGFIYSNPEVAKQIIAWWAESRAWSWNELYKTMQYEYNPVHNYDRFEEWTDNDSYEDANTNKNLNKVAAFNASDLVDSTSGDGEFSGTHSGRNTHKGHLYGNIGVTTATQMIGEQRESVKFDFYAVIIKEFKERFCILVY